MIRPITNLDTTEKNMISFSKNNTEVDALLKFGSGINETFDLYSDLDYFILTDNIKIIQEKLELLSPIRQLHYSDRSVLFFEFPSKIIDIRKVDINFSNTIYDYLKHVKKNDNLENAILVDKIGLPPLAFDDIERFSIEKQLSYHINRSVESFENCSVANQSSDKYRFSYYQAVALRHLYQLEYLANITTDYPYLPKALTNTIDKEVKEVLYVNFDPVSELHVGRNIRENLLEKFEYIYKRLQNKFDHHDFKIDNPIPFLRKILKRDWIWNIRDISDSAPDKVKSGVLIRSSALSFYVNEVYFEELYKSYNINSIIDLRFDEEINEFPYNGLNVPYYNIPIGAKHVSPHGLRYIEIGVEPFYYEYFPRHYHEEIFNIFQAILEAATPIVLHCYAGKDRTGIIVAMIQKLLGLDDETIIFEYLSSRANTHKEKIMVTLKLIEEFGGIVSYLSTIGLAEENIQKLTNMFVV